MPLLNHHNLNEYMKLYLKNKEDWDEHVKYAIMAYNSTENTETGLSPYELIFGKSMRLPSEFPPLDQLKTYDDVLYELVKKLNDSKIFAALNLNKAKYKSKEIYDKNAKSVHYRIGQLVYIKNEPKKSKHDDDWLGPFEIIKVNSKNTVEIEIDKKHTKIVHVDKIKKLR